MHCTNFQGKRKNRRVNFDDSPEREFSDFQHEVNQQDPESEQVQAEQEE